MLNIVPLFEEYIESMSQIEKESFSDDPWSLNMFLDLLDNSLAVCYIALEDDEVAGYLIAYHILSELQILNIAVKKSMRNKKIATKLFEAMFDYAKSRNINEFTLEVRPSNAGAIALYKKFGFETDGVRKNYYKNPKEDALLMGLRGG